MMAEKRRTTRISRESESHSSERKPEVEFAPPLKPHPKLFILLGLLLLIWLGVLVYMRLATVTRSPRNGSVDAPAATR